jgi:hypothetical protein
MKKIDLIITTNGRKEYILPTINSWKNFIDSNINNKIIIDDSGNQEYRDWLSETFPDFTIMPLGENNMGFSFLMKTWLTNLKFESKYLLLLEDDFLLLENIDVDKILNILDNNDNIIQLCLKRQAWSQEEVAAGGMIERIYNGSNFIQKDGWFEHREFFTTNPSFMNVERLRRYAKPIYENSSELITEGEFGNRLFSNNNNLYSAFLGAIFDTHKVEHIGHIRTGTYG